MGPENLGGKGLNKIDFEKKEVKQMLQDYNLDLQIENSST
jgi:hypothetical protein